jgi:hypothetical protein
LSLQCSWLLSDLAGVLLKVLSLLHVDADCRSAVDYNLTLYRLQHI